MTKLLAAAPALLLTLSACVGQPPATQSTAALGATTDCIDQDQIISRYPGGNNALIFEMTGGVTYRNDLASSCPNLEKRTAADTYKLEISGARLCVNDKFRAFDPVEARAVGTGAFPACRLGRFTRIARSVP